MKTTTNIDHIDPLANLFDGIARLAAQHAKAHSTASSAVELLERIDEAGLLTRGDHEIVRRLRAELAANK